jgi:hypothetical protein
MTPTSLYEAKPRVGSDWLLSSSKLQPCLELCRFTQVLLKTKVARCKAHFLLRICKKTHVQHSSERIAYYSRYVTEKKDNMPLESHSYNKSHPSPKASCFSKTDERKPFLVVSNPFLTFLSSACISLTPAQVYSLVCMYL